MVIVVWACSAAYFLHKRLSPVHDQLEKTYKKLSETKGMQDFTDKFYEFDEFCVCLGPNYYEI